MIFDLHISHGYKIDNYSNFVDRVFNGKELAKDFTVLIDYDQEDYYAVRIIPHFINEDKIFSAIMRLFLEYGVSLDDFNEYFSLHFAEGKPDSQDSEKEKQIEEPIVESKEKTEDNKKEPVCLSVHIRIKDNTLKKNIYDVVEFLKNNLTDNPEDVIVSTMYETRNIADLYIFHSEESDLKAMLRKAAQIPMPKLEEKYVINIREVYENIINHSRNDSQPEFYGNADDDLFVIEPRENDDKARSVLDEINALQGAYEFKEYCAELHQRAGVIKEHNTQNIFLSTIHMFYVNPSNGYKTAVELLDKLLKADDIFISSNTGYKESYVPTNSEELEKLVKALYSAIGDRKVVSFDISGWIGKTDSLEFKEFLKAIRKIKNALIIFHSILVSKDEIAKTNKNLSDILPIRPIVINDLNIRELHAIASNILNEYNYELSDTASMLFDQKIEQEKEDGYFYGVNTVEKVVVEMINAAETGKDPKNTCISDDVLKTMLTKKDTRTSQELFDSLYGLDSVKAQLQEAIDQIKFVRNSGKVIAAPTMHMKFLGAPGTGKTTVARILGKALKEEGLLEKGNLFEYRGRDLCGQYIGQTAAITKDICRNAYGSVLFIDEAYSLYKGKDNERDYGKEAVVTLMTEMENHPNDLLVIFAGYDDEMDKLMEANPGLSSRLPFTIRFDNYSGEELYHIFETMATKDFECEKALLDEAKKYFTTLSKEIMDDELFGNARFVRNLYEATWRKAVSRCRNLPPESVKLTSEDFFKALADQPKKIKREIKIGF